MRLLGNGVYSRASEGRGTDVIWQEKASMLRQKLKGNCIKFMFPSKLREIISWLGQRNEII